MSRLFKKGAAEPAIRTEVVRDQPMTRQGSRPGKLFITAELRNQYRAGALTLRQLATLYGVSVATVWRQLKHQGIARGSRRGRPPNSKRRSLVLQLAGQGWTRRQIADHLGITPEWVRVILADNGLAVPMRTLNCPRCGTPVASGHKAYQACQPSVCLGCLRLTPNAPFAERLKALRLARNLSVAQLSVRSGLSRTSIQNYERHQALPTPASLRKLAQCLEGVGSAKPG
jgi:transcriptional regulator with XRE-family HTH domain